MYSFYGTDFERKPNGRLTVENLIVNIFLTVQTKNLSVIGMCKRKSNYNLICL